MSKHLSHDLVELEKSLGTLHVQPPSEGFFEKGNSILNEKAKKSADNAKTLWFPFLFYALGAALFVSLGVNILFFYDNTIFTKTAGHNNSAINLAIAENNAQEKFNQAGSGASIDTKLQILATKFINAEQLYVDHCKMCHEHGIGGAPRRGYLEDWKPRISKGMGALINNSVFSFSNKPPCPTCSEKEIEAIIDYMTPIPAPRLISQSVQYLANILELSFASAGNDPLFIEKNKNHLALIFPTRCKNCEAIQQALSHWQSTPGNIANVSVYLTMSSESDDAHARAVYAAMQINNEEDIGSKFIRSMQTNPTQFNSADSFAPLCQSMNLSFEQFQTAYQSAVTTEQVFFSHELTRQLEILGLKDEPGIIITTNNGEQYLIHNDNPTEMMAIASTLLNAEGTTNNTGLISPSSEMAFDTKGKSN